MRDLSVIQTFVDPSVVSRAFVYQCEVKTKEKEGSWVVGVIGDYRKGELMGGSRQRKRNKHKNKLKKKENQG
jgi:hypothetical protein